MASDSAHFASLADVMAQSPPASTPSQQPPGTGMGDESDSVESLEDALNRHDDDGWEDVEEDVEQLNFVSLFEDKSFRDLKTMLDHDRNNHGFDLLQQRKNLALDFIDSMKLINYIRSEVKQGKQPADIVRDQFVDDKFLQPILEDDAVLYSLEDTDEVQIEDDRPEESSRPLPDAAAQENFLREVEARSDSPGASKGKSKVDKNDASYFESYSFREIHEVMLKDKARTDSYRDFIYGNKDLFEGKTVLDVGCGTGILSMMCAKAGASKVFAVDNSAIIEKARVNVFVNKLDSKVSCLRGKVEEIQLPVEHVDIIVSEWMGYGLLYEAMLDSVIFARDKWLRADGLMVPSDIKLFIAPLADSELVMDKISFWNDVYGFDMTSMQENIHQEPLVEATQVATVVSELEQDVQAFLHFDLHHTTVKELVFGDVPFSFQLNQDVDALDGFVLWFDAIFNRRDTADGKGAVTLSTGPLAKDTHWHQVKLLIDHIKHKVVPLSKDERVRGSIGYARPAENTRQLVISAKWASGGGRVGQQQMEREEGEQSWTLE